MSRLGYEIDFLPVGPKGKGGDAIALRIGYLKEGGDQFVAVIDGGYREDGDKLAEHIENFYNTKRIDAIINTHPDDDHTNGLVALLENEDISVGELYMHLPWEHVTEIQEAVRDRRATPRGMYRRIVESLDKANNLYELAVDRGIPIIEPFEGVFPHNFLHILGPSKDFYLDMLKDFRDISRYTEARESMLRRMWESVAKKLDDWGFETLSDPELHHTTPENNSSAICLLQVPDCPRYLLTGDAGAVAIDYALDYVESQGLNPRDIERMQIPHHGSRRNVGPTLLNRILGPKGDSEPESYSKSALISTPKENPDGKHPAQRVINAYHRRSCKPVATQNASKSHTTRSSYNAPDRPGWVTATPEPFREEEVEE